MLGLGLLLVLLVALVATVPIFPYSQTWGYGPLTVLLVLTLIWAALMWMGWVGALWPWSAPAPVEG